MKRTKTGKDLRKEIKKKQKNDKKITKEDFLWIPSGSIMFNLACSDHWYGAYKTGTMVNIIGDSSSGKSILTLSGIAAAANDPKFDNYRLISDDSEFADSFDHVKLFGSKFASRIEAPNQTEEIPEKGKKKPKKLSLEELRKKKILYPINIWNKEKKKFEKNKKIENSVTIEQFFDNVMDAIDIGIPFIYCQDSFDSIDADAEIKKELKNREYRKKGNLSKIKGSFQATKQKKASQMFRQICSKLKQSKSLLIIISQTRDNLNALSFETKYRAGGRALKFYASIEAWLAYKSPLTKTVNDKKHAIGVNTVGKITKNKYTGKRKEAEFPIYTDYGIDDISSCIDFLIENDYWELNKQTIIAEELDIECTKKKLIPFIEENKLQETLFQCTEKCWNEIEDALKLNRRSKFE